MSPAQLTSAAAVKGSVLDVLHQLWQIIVEVEMVPGKYAEHELSRRSIPPGRHVVLGRNPILVSDERVNGARHLRVCGAVIAGNGTSGSQRGQHPYHKLFIGEDIRIH